MPGPTTHCPSPSGWVDKYNNQIHSHAKADITVIHGIQAMIRLTPQQSCKKLIWQATIKDATKYHTPLTQKKTLYPTRTGLSTTAEKQDLVMIGLGPCRSTHTRRPNPGGRWDRDDPGHHPEIPWYHAAVHPDDKNALNELCRLEEIGPRTQKTSSWAIWT